MKLQLLDKETIDNLHADQIITDLPGALKELFDNAIDASATRITANFTTGPTFELEVADDGCGIAREDLDLIALRGATSKLDSCDDFMDKISYLGFRVDSKG
jgi:DNA mismatch repair protein MutL